MGVLIFGLFDKQQVTLVTIKDQLGTGTKI